MDNKDLWLVSAVIILIFVLSLHFGIKLLSWLLYKKYGVKLKVGGYGFMCFRDLHLQLRSGLKLEIEYLGVSSSFLNSNLKSLIVFCINDIRLQGDTDWLVSRKSNKAKDRRNSTSPLSFKYASLLKFISLQVSNVSMMQLGKSEEEFLLHLSFKEFNLYFCRFPERIQLNVSVLSSTIKVFKHQTLDQGQHHSTESCICHFASNIQFSVDATLNKSIKIQSVCATISQPELMLYEGFSLVKFKNYALNDVQTKKQVESVVETDISNIVTPKEWETTEKSLDFKEKLKKLPGVSEVSIDSFSVKIMMKGGHRTFSFGVNFISLHLEVGHFNENGILPDISSSIEIKEITAASDHAQFGQLIKCGLGLNVSKELLDVKFNISVLHVLYQKEVLQYLFGGLFSSTNKHKSIQKEKIKREASFKEFLTGYRIKSSVALENISVSFQISETETFSLGLVKGLGSLEHANSLSVLENSVNTKSLNSGSNFELLLETFYLKLGDLNFTDYGMLKKYHYNFIPISLGMVLFKVRTSQVNCNIECMIDGCHLQWCPVSSQLMLNLLKYKNFLLPKSSMSNESDTSNMEPQSNEVLKKLLSIELNLRDMNLFALNEYNTGISIRTDLLKVTSSVEKAKVLLEGLKISYLSSLSKIYHCVRCSEIKFFDVFVEDASFIYLLKCEEATIRINENMYLNWNTTLHMTVFTIVSECLVVKNIVICPSTDSNGTLKIPHLATATESSVNSKKSSKAISLFLQAKGNIKVDLVLSEKHKIEFSSNDITLNYNQQMISTNSEQLIVAFDNHEVFTFENILVSLMEGNDQHLLCRQSFDELELTNNRLLSIHFEAVKFVFPYKYNFAEAFTEEFMNAIKWLKLLHNKKKVPFTLESKLPPDLHIVCKLWTVELEDDPFEVKLRDISELLEDEYHESLKRKRMLDEKIDILQRTNLLVPIAVEKFSLLYAKLAKKNADIYVQRSQQLYQKSSIRTSLCTWFFEDVDIIAIADVSYHGTERVVDRMKLLDPDSPFPEEGIEFTTLWARKVKCSVVSWTWQMRDFPQMPLVTRELHVWGFLIGAEQEASQRARRSASVEIDEPWSNAMVERSMPSLKFYHDLTFDVDEMSMAYGPSWEPIMAQISLAMEFVSRPSLDPSPGLPWWDKLRLLYHGRLTIIAQHLHMYMRASLDPYNTTEHMEISWTELFLEWANGKVLTKGDLDMYVHTASKYDDIRVIHIPHLKLSVSLTWLCLGNPYDHHNVMPCAPDKVPEYSINQEHDSYRAFRSQKLNISFSYETRSSNNNVDDVPTMLLYSSTLKWIENLKMILSGVTRLTRRGVLFNNTKPRKPQLSRHYSRLCVSLNLHRFKIIYWMSFAKQRGLELVGGRLFLSSEHTHSLSHVNDGLKHRPCSNWNIGYLTMELSDSEIWLHNCMGEETEKPAKSFQDSLERSYFLSVNRVSYGREEIVKGVLSEEDKEETPTHCLVVHGLKGAWTRHNRLVIFSLVDSYQKTVLLKKNLSTEALRCFKLESQNTPQKVRSQTNVSLNCASAGPSPISNLQSSHAASMLQKLVAEAEANPMVFTEEIEGTAREQQLHGITACQTDDVLQKKWLIELVNSQVMLRGCETSGYVIMSAAKAKLLQKLHTPVWKDRSLVSKTTWVGSFECMQYYATVDPGAPSPSVDNVMWLSVDNIEEREPIIISDLPDLVGSGHSVGGVISNTVGPVSNPESAPTQLQRIVSRCGCQFFYASFGENMDPTTLEEVPPLPEDTTDLWEQEVAVDSFTLTHHDLDMCTNSLQYAMILDIVNNLLLYVEPRRKEATNKLQYMRFQLQLCSVEDQREPILQLQENIRSLVSYLRRLEKEAYVIHKLYQDNPDNNEYLDELHVLEHKIHETKEQLNSMNEELTMMISCFKETQIIASRSRQRASSQDKGVTPSRRSEVCFKHAQWRLTDPDGQLGISDLILSNFLYSKTTKTDDSVEHLLEVGYIKMTNLLPNQAYKVVLQPTELQTKIPLDRQCLLRIFCRERAPVGGISIKEHLEVNVVPITIGLTEAFYRAMLKFFFPGRDAEKAEDEDEEPIAATSKKPFNKKQVTMFYGERDDIEKMKERAEKNHTFFSIKIPEVPIRVSYKGKKEKNIEDVQELSLVLSTLEYHNKTWTWLDLLMALKNDAKKILLSQAIKQKLLKSRHHPEMDNQPQEEEKAMILLGTQHIAGQDKTLKRGFLSRIRKDHH